MSTEPVSMEFLTLLGELLCYPREDAGARARKAAQSLRAVCPKAAGSLEQFVDSTRDWTTRQYQETYTVAFDLSPLAIPYLSVYLFGAESPKRADLMVGLNTSYERAGTNLGGELPDHIGWVLWHAGVFTDEEWRELSRYCLSAPVKAMAQALRNASNPYQHVMCAAQHLLETHATREVQHV